MGFPLAVGVVLAQVQVVAGHADVLRGRLAADLDGQGVGLARPLAAPLAHADHFDVYTIRRDC